MHVGPVIAVDDLRRARDFYEDQLGLTGVQTPGGWAIQADEGTVLYLLPGISAAGSATWPVASFRVSDVHAKVRELRTRDVPFFDADDLPFELDDDGISVDQSGMEVAWMRDPDGNIVTVFSTSS